MEKIEDPLPEILFLGFCTGDANIIGAALFRSNEHMSEFLTRRLRRFPRTAAR